MDDGLINRQTSDSQVFAGKRFCGLREHGQPCNFSSTTDEAFQAHIAEVHPWALSIKLPDYQMHFDDSASEITRAQNEENMSRPLGSRLRIVPTLDELVRSPAIEKALTSEVGQPLKWWWLSFVNPSVSPVKFLGAIICQAPGIGHATKQTHALGINPGGEVRFYTIPDDRTPPAEYRDRLLTPDELEELVDKMGIPLRNPDRHQES